MDLIIKPTGACNFKCTFCSASNLNNIQHPSSGKIPEKLVKLIKDIYPGRLIITGGEGLLVSPLYYYELHQLQPDAPISITSNLKDFYHNPEKWSKLFNEEWFNVITSFNYGDARMWDENTVYTVDMFMKVWDLFFKTTGKRLPFIAIIDDDNYDRILDHVYLARDLGTTCKLNGVVAVGRQAKTFPRWKMMQSYLEIIRLGLDKYEMTCIDRHMGGCSMNISLKCHSSIRCAYVNTDNELEYSYCDETMSDGFRIPIEESQPKQVREPVKNIKTVNKNCYSCELFALCNGCNSFRNKVHEHPEHCSEMLKLKDEIIKTDWRLH